jgi:hypothetical protein
VTYFGQRTQYLERAGPVQPQDELPLVDPLLPSNQVVWEHDRLIQMTEQGREVTRLWDEPQVSVAGAELEFPALLDHYRHPLRLCH